MLQIVGTFILNRRNEMSKTDELELEIYQQIKSLEPRQQRIIYDKIITIFCFYKFILINYTGK